MYTPLYDRIKKLNTYPMHMPGHKRRFFNMSLDKLDITEISGADNLHCPQGVIKEAMELMAEAVGADETLFCVNGGSSGIISAILGTCGENDRLLTVKNAHRSIYSGIILSGCKADFISPSITPYGICGGVSPNDIEEELKKHSDIKAVLIVSPTYEGFVSDVKKIAHIVHKYNKILIVDETHGAHFPFGSAFPESAIQLGADITINSWHKTLPALGQCAILNMKGNRIDRESIKAAHSITNTTSPSYIFMGTMDYVRGYITENSRIIEEYQKNMLLLQKELNKLTTFENAIKLKGKFEIYDYDISKLTLFYNNGYTEDFMEKYLLEKSFSPELADNVHIIGMTSFSDDIEMLKKYCQIFKELDNTNFVCRKSSYSKPEPTIRDNIREIFFAPKEFVPIENAIGRTAGDFITAFPPDIPIVILGERLTSKITEKIKKCKDKVTGIENNKIKVMKG